MRVLPVAIGKIGTSPAARAQADHQLSRVEPFR
jgi:hypothetical protein